MDTQRTSDPSVIIVELSLSEANDIGGLVDNFRHWETIATAGYKEPMMFMLEFSRDCKFAVDGSGTLVYPFESGQVSLSGLQLSFLSKFIKACVDMEGKSMSWQQRTY
ncbi:MAG: hypothetical protein GY789_06190 [Hyphomicrobiales bacterium]|nr:hypothetical protein [Hyphomicrobiales bacterium]